MIYKKNFLNVKSVVITEHSTILSCSKFPNSCGYVLDTKKKMNKIID